MILYLDTETFSEKPIKYGVHSYAEAVEVMIITWATDDYPTQTIDLTNPAEGGIQHQMPTYMQTIVDAADTIVIHNSSFDRTVMRHGLGINIPIEKVEDTMVQAQEHGLPGGLGILCDIFGLGADQAKDKDGKKLINLFCKPRPKNMKLRRATRETHPKEWQSFLNYAASDIVAMRALHKKLPRWNYPDNKEERALWILDQKINERGFFADKELAEAAIRATDIRKQELADETLEKTFGEVTSSTQRDKFLKHLLSEYGVDLPDLQKATLERRVNDQNLPREVRELLSIRLQASTTSTAKYDTLIQALSADGRLRGGLQFCGASRTRRWSGRVFQPQNLPRPSLKADEVNVGIEALKADCANLIFPDVMELASSCIRGCITSTPGKKLVVSDLSNIEGRAAAWLAQEEWKLQAFRDFDNGEGEDLYKLAYGRAFQINAADVNGDQRQIGKVMELALGYQGGVGAFVTFAAGYGMDIAELTQTAWATIPQDIMEEARGWWEAASTKGMTSGLPQDQFMVCDSLKRLWRRAHPNVERAWHELEEAAATAIMRPGGTVMHKKIGFRRDGAWLRMLLPSGGVLCYASPRVDDQGKITYMGMDQYTRKWQRQGTYGGKLFENACQAVARDVMAANMPLIENDGFEILLSVHDELITEVTDNSRVEPEERLSNLLATVPKWATGMPLAAAGFEDYRYRKD